MEGIITLTNRFHVAACLLSNTRWYHNVVRTKKWNKVMAECITDALYRILTSSVIWHKHMHGLTWNLSVLCNKETKKKVHDVICASFLHYIISRDQSKCKNGNCLQVLLYKFIHNLAVIGLSRVNWCFLSKKYNWTALQLKPLWKSDGIHGWNLYWQ